MGEDNLPALVISSSLSASVPEVSRLVAILTCPICYELQEHPTSTPCNHSFCSLCIRKYLQFKPQCPTCHGSVYEQNLRTDKTLEDIMLLVRPMLINLEKLLVANPLKMTKNSDDHKENEEPTCPGSVSSNLVRASTQPLSPLPIETTKIAPKPLNQPSLKVKAESELLTYPNRTPCPVCNVPIPDRAIDQHVEKCLSTRKAPPPITKPVKKRSTLPKLVYNLLKDGELKKKCKEFGLNQKGDRKSLINRLQKYTLLYNTESQLDNPKSKLEIVMQVEREEKEEKAGKIPTPSLLQFDRKTESEVIEKKQKQYLQENKDAFNDMIKQVRERNKKNKIKNIVSNDVRTVVETVENLEDVAAGNEERKSIEDLSGGEFCEPIFEVLPGPSIETSEVTLINVTSSTSCVKKRSMSPSVISGSPPRKLPKTITPIPINSKQNLEISNRCSNKSVYITPEKSQVEGLLKSPMKTQNIFERLTASGEQMKKYPKILCPVCNIGVTEKFLNIHLDKCLKIGEDPSPIIKRTKSKDTKLKKTKKSTVREHIVKRTIIESDDSDADRPVFAEDSDFEDDAISCHATTRTRLHRSVIKPSIIDSSDDPFIVEEGNDDKPRNDDAIINPDINGTYFLGDNIPPTSPTFDKYTDTMTQGSYFQSQVNETGSNPDMFASGSEVENENRNDLDSSRNLLELDDDIELMMEAALSEDDNQDGNKTQPLGVGSSVQNQSRVRNKPDQETKINIEHQCRTEPDNGSKKDVDVDVQVKKRRAFVQIVPIEKGDKNSSELSITKPTSSKSPEDAPPRSTRRTTRSRSKAKLI